ncbi:PilZ domain-containing protein [Methylobacterium sp. NPDC080182]|uniref:PilZ domain-containing protein n=1 Tax=Methylobacterium sp. NPDC080182 TaxID=3390590 RepID=UPI003D0276B1
MYAAIWRTIDLNSIGRRVIVRHAIILPALCWLSDGTEFHAITVDISTEGIRLRSATIPPVSVRLGCSIRSVGTMQTRVVRSDATDFAVRVVGRGAMPREVVSSLLDLVRLQAPLHQEVRIHRRFVPMHRTVQVALPDGTGVPARILNLSASGVALQLSATLEIGEAIVVGRHRGRVARRIDGGIGVAFLAPLHEATLSAHTVL